MKPCRFLLISFFLLSHPATSQVFYDTVSVRSVGPGMMHYRIVAPSIPWNINVLTVDLNSPFISLETVKANDRLAGHEIMSSMASRKSSPGHDAVGAINGDFYASDGSPINIQIAQGEILLRPVSRPAVGFSDDNAPMIDVVTMTVTATLSDTVATVHGVNATRQTDQLILYNSYKGSTTGTNQFGTEALLRPVTSWIANDTVICVVDSIESGVGNMGIPQGRGVLSGHGASDSVVMSRLHVGDTVKLFQGIAPGLSRLKEMIGGNPNLVVGGQDVSYTAPREPRTAAGFSADSSILYLITVDGRQVNLSVGMTFAELAQFMIQIGVHEGINLDGGGSTTMVIRDSVMNSPSDGGERAVSNGLLVISSAPAGTLSSISISPKSTRIFRGATRQFAIHGADEYGNPAPTDPALVWYSCDPQIGTIDSVTGILTSISSPAEGIAVAHYGAWTDSAHVVVKPLGSISLAPTDLVTDTTRTISFTVDSYDVDNLRQGFPLDEYQWTSTNPAVGSISSTGVFKGSAEGTTGVVASLDVISDTARVRVEVGQGYAVLDPFEDLTNWTTSAVQVDSFTVTIVDSVATAGSSSVRIDYAFTASASISYIYLDTDIQVFGVPDSVIIDGRTDHHSHRIYYVIEDDNAEQFRLFSSTLMNKIGIPDVIRAPLSPSQAITSGAVFHYPVTIKRMEIQIVYNRQAGTFYSGTLFLDNLRVSYPQQVTSVEHPSGVVPREFRLSQNYPNPFNATTHVRFSVPVQRHIDLILYDILGRERKTVVSGVVEAGGHIATIEANDLPSGVYFLRAGGEGMQTVKLVLIR